MRPTALIASIIGLITVTDASPTPHSDISSRGKLDTHAGSDKIDVADGFKFKTRDEQTGQVDVADGFKMKARDHVVADGNHGVDVADGFKYKGRDANEKDGHIDVADGF